MERRLEDRKRLVETLANRHGRDLLDLRDLLHRQSAPEMRGDGEAEIFRQLQHRGTKPLSLFAFGEHGIDDRMREDFEMRLQVARRAGIERILFMKRFFWLRLLQQFKARFPHLPTKSGLMVGLGETDDEILAVMRDMRAHDIDMLTIGQYLQPSVGHLPVLRYVHPDTFAMFEREAQAMGFRHAAVGAMVRSSYHADQQAEAADHAVG